MTTLSRLTAPELNLQLTAPVRMLADVDLTGMSFPREIAHTSFTRCNFTSADLRGVILKDVEFTECDFPFTDLRETQLSDVTMTTCELRSASIRDAFLRDLEFHDCNLFDVDFSSAKLASVSASQSHFRGTQWKLAELDNCEFSNSDFSTAVFFSTTATRSRFYTVNFAKAIFAGSTFDNCDLPRANMSEARVRGRFPGCAFRDAEFSGAALFEAGFFGADLRTVSNAVYDTTYVRDAKFSEYSPDAWSLLRRKYTGPMFAFHLLLLIAFITPYVLKTVFWVGVNHGQESFERAATIVAATIADETGDARAKETLARLRMTPCLSARCRTYYVAELLMGADGTTVTWLLAVALLLYNLGRAVLTYRISLLRDAEERSGYTPAWDAYRPLLRLHRFVMQPLIAVAVVSFTYHLVMWLSRPVQLPA